VLGLGAFTLGIYGFLRFFQAGCSYQRVTGQDSTFKTFFWISVAIYVALPVALVFSLVSGGLAAFLVWLAFLAYSARALRDALVLRAGMVSQRRLKVPLRSNTRHLLLWMAGAIPFLGVIPLILEVAFFFGEQNSLATALREGLP
jgi:hypothetical protein